MARNLAVLRDGFKPFGRSAAVLSRSAPTDARHVKQFCTTRKANRCG